VKLGDVLLCDLTGGLPMMIMARTSSTVILVHGLVHGPEEPALQHHADPVRQDEADDGVLEWGLVPFTTMPETSDCDWPAVRRAAAEARDHVIAKSGFKLPSI
jgi:hypothetical protein